MAVLVFFQFYIDLDEQKCQAEGQQLKYTKLTRKASFSLKLMHLCILPTSFNWLLALLQRVELSGFSQASK